MNSEISICEPQFFDVNWSKIDGEEHQLIAAVLLHTQLNKMNRIHTKFIFYMEGMNVAD